MADCKPCDCHRQLGFAIKMAFQPIIAIESQTVFVHEAYVRGENGEGAAEVFKRGNDDTMCSFDQQCRVTAIK